MNLFTPFPKVPRWSKGWSVSEKINGANAQVLIITAAEMLKANIFATEGPEQFVLGHDQHRQLYMFAGSRNRLLHMTTRTGDNFGFAKWVRGHAEDLFRLGLGCHFGEWYGHGIQKNPYDLPEGERRLALFNPRWIDQGPECTEVVPQLGTAGDALELEGMYGAFKFRGTMVPGAGPNREDPEGIMIYHQGSGQIYKRTYENDGGKWNG